MIGEIWYYKAKMPNSDEYKSRPVLVIGDDSGNNLYFTDIHYVIISSSSSVGLYDIEISEEDAKDIGLLRKSVIKTTKIYTGPKTLFERKVCDLPDEYRMKFLEKYREYQLNLITKFEQVNVLEEIFNFLLKRE